MPTGFVYPEVFGHSKQLSLNKFFDPSTPSMRKGRDGGTGKKTGKKKRRMKIVATTLLASSLEPERRRTNADRWNAARSCQLSKIINVGNA